MSQVFTIGHSTDRIETFIEYLKCRKIDTIVDVRTTPYSRYATQFNKENLNLILKQHRIFYVYMGEELGARHTEASLLFDDGKVDFSKVATSEKFQKGISRVEKGIKKGHRIALMCSEKNPIECHRFSLISNYLHTKGYDIGHLVEKDIFDHKMLQEKLIEYFKTYHKITLDLKKIINFHRVQQTLFEDDRVNEKLIYLELNRIIGYMPAGNKEDMI